MKKVTLLVFIFSCAYNIIAQEIKQASLTVPINDALIFNFAKPINLISQSVMSASGGVSKYAEITLDWTLGETFISPAAYNEQLYTAGFHQPITLRHHLVYQSNSEKSKISIFPNPVANILNVSLNLVQQDFVKIILTDLFGRQLSTQSVDGKASKAEVSVGNLSAGSYQLQVIDMHGKPISAFKIIKSN